MNRRCFTALAVLASALQTTTVLAERDEDGRGQSAASITTAPAPAAPVKPALDRPSAELVLDLGDRVKLELVLIRPGTFTMGDNDDRDAKPAHKVTIARSFYLGKYEVTQEQWKAAMGAESPGRLKGPKLPVESVRWTECMEFCTRLNARFPGKGFRLPTEAEWEYACRAGSTTQYCCGDDVAALSAYAWYAGSLPPRSPGAPKDVSFVQPVGGKKPNAWGLYDMHGNVWEWCQTLMADQQGKVYSYPYVADDGREDTSANSIRKPGGPKMSRSIVGARIVRGGSWHHGEKAATSFHRAGSDPYQVRYYYGFRVLSPLQD